MRWLVAIGTVLLAALGAIGARIGSAHPDDVLGGGAPAAVVLEVAAGLAAWGAGAYAWVRLQARWSGGLLAAAGVSVLLTASAGPFAGSAPLFTAGLLGAGLVSVTAGAAALAYSGGRRGVAAACVATAAVLHTLVPALLLDPRDAGCFACPRNLVAVASDPHAHDQAARWGLRAVLATGGVLVVLALARWWRSAPVVRTATAAVVLPGIAAAALGSVAAANALAEYGAGFDGGARALWLAQCACALAMGLGVAARAVIARRLRDRVADLVVGALPDAERLRAELAVTLGDPSLALAFPRTGQPAPRTAEEPGRAVLSLIRDDRVVAEVIHDPALAAVPERVATAIRAAGLALEHAGEQSRLRTELADLSELRARIVAVGDAERRRLERDLHDGAQQRLIAIAIALQTARERDPDPQLARAAEEIRAALAELRAIAHGIHPVTLTDAGLAAALRELAEDGAVPVRIERLPDRRAEAPVEAAAYRVIADAVRCAERADGGAPVRVRVACEADELRAEIEVAGGDPEAYAAALAGAADRARALGGRVRVRDGVAIELRTPCAS